MSWDVEWCHGSAANFHSRDIPEVARRSAWVFEIATPALVLGSTQSLDVVDLDACRQAGVEVVKRRSGGGAVLLLPGEVTWVDLVIPRGDSLWVDDVGRSMEWLGELWVTVVARFGLLDADVHRGPMVTNEWSRLICFAGLGPGEVVTPAGKLVGISQRRTRSAARFQCAMYRTWNPELIRSLLVGDAPDVGSLPPVASLDVSPDSVVTVLIGHLPA